MVSWCLGEVLKVLRFCVRFRLANIQEYEMETLSTPCATSTTTSCANIPGQHQIRIATNNGYVTYKPDHSAEDTYDDEPGDEITYDAVPGDDLPPVQEEDDMYEEIPVSKRDACY